MVAHRLNPFQNYNCGDANMKSATILARPMVTQLACTVSIALNAAQALAFNIFPWRPVTRKNGTTELWEQPNG